MTPTRIAATLLLAACVQRVYVTRSEEGRTGVRLPVKAPEAPYLGEEVPMLTHVASKRSWRLRYLGRGDCVMLPLGLFDGDRGEVCNMSLDRYGDVCPPIAGTLDADERREALAPGLCWQVATDNGIDWLVVDEGRMP